MSKQPTSSVGSKLQPTPKQVLGPFFLEGSPLRGKLSLIRGNGQRLRISGQVLSESGQVIPNAMVHVWLADADGVYDNQDAHGREFNLPVEQHRLRGRVATDTDGKYAFRCVRPGNYPLDNESVDMRPGHIHIKIEAAGHRTLVTQLYFQDDEFNTKDIPREDFFQPELVVHLQPALPKAGETQRGFFNFVLAKA